MILNSKQLKNEPGFTLIEILVVVAIISLLSSFVLASLEQAKHKAEVAAGKKFSNNVRTIVGLYNVSELSFSTIDGSTARDKGGYEAEVVGAEHKTAEECGLGFGGCLEFDGDEDYVELSNDLSDPELFGGRENGEVTVSFWVHPTGDTWHSGETLFRRIGGIHYMDFKPGTSGRLQVMVKCKSRTRPCNTRSANYWPKSNATLSRNEWTHIAFVLDAGEGWRYYINGKLDNYANEPKVVIHGYGGRSRIGYKLTKNWSDFQGMIDEFRVYARAFTQDEAENIFDKGH